MLHVSSSLHSLLRPPSIDGSAQFVRASSQYLSRTPAGAGDRTQWTWAGWIKRSSTGSTQRFFSCNASNDDNGTFEIYWGLDDTIRCSAWTINWLVSTATFTNTTTWYHVCCAVNTNDGTANNRIRLYVSGTEITSFSTRNNPSLSASLGVNQAAAHGIGRSQVTGGTDYSDQLLADVHFIDGQQLSPWSFVTNGGPRPYQGQYGTNGLRLDFRNAGNVGLDVSGKGNSWTNNGATKTQYTPVPA